MSVQRKNVLITGGAGFIGSALAKKLSSTDQFNIIVIDDLSNPESGRRRAELQLGVDCPPVGFIAGSAKDAGRFIEKMKLKLDYIFHFGEYSRVQQSFDDFVKCNSSNSQFGQILHLARTTGAKLIYSASSTLFSGEVDGLSGKQQSPYAFSKAQNLELLKEYSRWFDWHNYATVFFYNVYGPGESESSNYATVIAKYAKMVKDGATELPVYGNGFARRNFTHIDDTVNGIILAAEQGLPAIYYGIAAEESYTIGKVVEMFGCTPVFLPDQRGNRLTASAESSGNMKALGWKQLRQLEDYINEILEKVSKK